MPITVFKIMPKYSYWQGVPIRQPQLLAAGV